MREITKEELKTIIENNKHWWNEDCDGWEKMRADLRGADLQGADLQGAYLQDAYLQDAYLQGADLRRADLRRADLQGADLRGAYLRRADLQGAYLRGADLQGADLQGADLRGAYLRHADLQGAYLRRADLRDAYLQGADLRSAKNVPYIPIACPDAGSFIGWKKDGSGKLIIKLLIPEDAKRLSATGRKCRCDKAQVLAIENLDGTPSDKMETYSQNNSRFIYKIGETVTPEKNFCEDRWQECSSGIHFFINRKEAVEY